MKGKANGCIGYDWRILTFVPRHPRLAMDSSLTALSPVDGRYRAATAGLAQLLSEGALVCERIRVEALWLLQLGESLPDLPAANWSRGIKTRLAELSEESTNLELPVRLVEAEELELRRRG